jgi:putative two-component system response regulator
LILPARVGDGEAPLVLIVDDNPDVRDLYAMTLSRAGCRVVEAHNGFQALEKVAELLPDLVITEVRIPGLTGFELCRALRRNNHTREIPVIVMTASELHDLKSRAEAAGCDLILEKGTDPPILFEHVRRLLAWAKGSRSAPQ